MFNNRTAALRSICSIHTRSTLLCSGTFNVYRLLMACWTIKKDVTLVLCSIAVLMLGRATTRAFSPIIKAFLCKSSLPPTLYSPRLYSSSNEDPFPFLSPTDADISSTTRTRRDLLLDSLQELQIDVQGLDEAALQSIQNAMGGYDGRYGKSAIKTYRAFLYPKKEQQYHTVDSVQLKAAAGRCARQIDFLLRRHKSHANLSVRHHDNPNLHKQQQQNRTTFPLVLVLDNMRSAFNVGSIFRTADAAGCSWVFTTGITPHPAGSGSDKLSKSALGAEYVVPSRHFTTTRQAIECIRAELPEYQLIGLETTEKSVCYTDYKYGKEAGAVLVLGNEVTGVNTDIMPLLDAIVQIPMFGAKNSLNVAACAPVVLYEILRQWRKDDT